MIQLSGEGINEITKLFFCQKNYRTVKQQFNTKTMC